MGTFILSNVISYLVMGLKGGGGVVSYCVIKGFTPFLKIPLIKSV